MAFFLQRRSITKLVQQQLERVSRLGEYDSAEERGPIDECGTISSFPIDAERLRYRDAVIKDAYLSIPGITSQVDHSGEWYYNVGWTDSDDKFNPKQWSTATRLGSTILVCIIALITTAASSIDSAVSTSASNEFGVTPLVESLATGLFLVGFGAGALLASPLSELVGRQPVYIASLVVFGGWTVGSALAPNIHAQLIFRFLMGLSASPPLTVAGGSISDMWSPLERTFAFPIFAVPGFGGAVLGPVFGTYIGGKPELSWRWVEWLMLIITCFCIVLVLTFKRETFPPRILYFKAAAFRAITGDARFKTTTEATDSSSVHTILKRSFMRPFLLCLEPIVLSFTLYLTMAYIILFTFLDGYTDIFARVYGITEELSNTCFLGLFIGLLLSFGLVPFIYRYIAKQIDCNGGEKSGTLPNRESRLYFAMVGAPALPIGLFWMAWTDYPTIPIWSPLAASVLIGFGIICIYMSANMYIIDSYEMYAASALTFNALVRYLAAGGMAVVGIPMYENLGTHWTLTVLGGISALAVPIPFVVFRWGPKLRSRSKWAC